MTQPNPSVRFTVRSAMRITFRLIAMLSLFVSLTLVASTPLRQAHTSSAGPAQGHSKKGVDLRLSSMGQLSQRVRRFLAANQGQASLLGDEEQCDSTPDDCEDGYSEGPAGGQSETSIAVDASGLHVVVGFNDTRGFNVNPNSISGFMYSDDGGQTFTDGGQLPVTTGTSTIGSTVFPQPFGDPEVKYLGGCNFVYFQILLTKFSATAAAQTMGLHRSTDCGHTWTGPFEIPSATNPNGAFTSGGNPVDAADKEFADVDPDTGRVLMSWSNFTSTTFAPAGVEISATYSDNIMSATPPTWSPRSVIAATAADGQASIPRFVGNGSSNAYIAWRRFPGGLGQNVGFARSTDNGVTWSAPINTTLNFLTMDQVLGNDRVNTSPSLAVDSTNGNVYLVFSSNNSRDGADVAFQRSTNGGVSFSSPIFLNSRPGADRAQFFPWVNVDKDTGRVYVSYYDQGIAPNGDLTEMTYLFSDDGGTTWSKPTPLSARPFHAGWGNDTGQPNLGDYNQAVAQNGQLFITWAGTSLLPFTDGLPSASMTTPDVIFKRVPASASRTSLRLGTVTFTDGNANGFVDGGETVGLTIPLNNYVTNPLSQGTISSISATLSTSTPGVNVTQSTSTYPNLAAGATSNNGTPFTIQTTSTFVIGTHIELTLIVTSAQGNTTLLYTLPTGTPKPTTIFAENFNGVAAGSLPTGWTTSHAGGTNTVPWTTNSTFCSPGSNAAFHQNANDATNPVRFERLFSPIITVPSNAEYVTLDFDVCYDTEDDPNFNIWAYDGFLLRLADLGPTTATPAVLRSVLIEAFAEEFSTDGFNHFPKHFPRSSNANYFQDMSAWAGFSNGFQHVHLKFPGMAGRFVQMRWEYTQDSSGTCADVRPGHPCGVMVDNIVMKSVKSVEPTSLTLAAAAGQYSDAVTLKATVSPTTADGQTATGNVQFFVNGVAAGAPVAIDSNGIATSSYTITQAKGSYPISATFTSGNPAFGDSSGTNTVAVSKEDANVTASPLSPTSVKVNSAGGTAGPVTLIATIKEVSDGSAGDISLASPVSIVLNPILGGSALTCPPAVLTGGGVGGTLTASCTLTNVPVNVYDVTINIGGDYYTGSGDTVLAVYDPSLGFVTGGGTIIHNGVPANFGFSVKFNNGGNAQGSFLYSEHRSTGDVKLKSNALQTLAIVGNTAAVIGKATLSGVGNYAFRATVVDNGEPGNADQLGLQVIDPSGAPVVDLTFPLTTLAGGNIQVPQQGK